MIEEIANIDRKLGINIRMLKKAVCERSPDVWEKAGAYLKDYCSDNKISPQQVIDAVNKFNEKYSIDIKNFLQSGKYPFELGNHNFDLSRQEYDLFLMTSFLFVEHRYFILEELSKLKFDDSSIAIIGAGSGVEIDFISEDISKISAFDIELSEFVKLKHPGVLFKQQSFEPVANTFDAVIALELIEHLESPYKLICEIADSLKNGGKLIITVAKNIPQFDHRYNFSSTDEFEYNMVKLGFKLMDKCNCKHDYKFYRIDAETVFYVFIFKK